jgi:hypothetical protein
MAQDLASFACKYRCVTTCGPLTNYHTKISYANADPTFVADCTSGDFGKQFYASCRMGLLFDAELFATSGVVSVLEAGEGMTADTCLTATLSPSPPSPPSPSPPPPEVSSTAYRVRPVGLEKPTWRVNEVDFGCSFLGGAAAEPSPELITSSPGQWFKNLAPKAFDFLPHTTARVRPDASNTFYIGKRFSSKLASPCSNTPPHPRHTPLQSKLPRSCIIHSLSVAPFFFSPAVL